MIYVISERDDDTGPVKIGFTKGPASAATVMTRLNTLQAATWRRLAVVGMRDGEIWIEGKIGLRFEV